ncbi:MAG: SLBB domain-containing protein [Armatimonadota bacterium]
MVRLQALLILALSLLVGAAFAGEPPITPGDRLTVVVEGEKELSRTYVVDQDGKIAVPLDGVGKLEVKGLYPNQVQERLADALKKFILNPQVTVEFGERAKINVSVTGQVTRPGQVSLQKGGRLLDALGEVGGETITADIKRLRLTRRGEPEARTFDLAAIRADEKLNLELQDGDAIEVPAIPMLTYRVLGAVEKTGMIQRLERATLLDLIGEAGGTNPVADETRVQVLTRDASQPQLISLKEIRTGKMANPVLPDGAVVTVPEFPHVIVKVFGALDKPGELRLREGSTLIDALTAAGPFKPEADQRAIIVEAGAGQVQRCAVEKVDDASRGMPLKDGMRISVPVRAPIQFAVAGAVQQPNVFPYPRPDEPKVFVTDALARAGGVSGEKSKKPIVVVFRKSASGGEPEQIAIDWEALFGKDLKKRDPSKNIEIQPNDVVYVDVEAEGQRRPGAWEKVLGVARAFIPFL